MNLNSLDWRTHPALKADVDRAAAERAEVERRGIGTSDDPLSVPVERRAVIRLSYRALGHVFALVGLPADLRIVGVIREPVDTRGVTLEVTGPSCPECPDGATPVVLNTPKGLL